MEKLTSPNTKQIDFDAWQCKECFGKGNNLVYKKVSHLLGSDELQFLEECEACEGIGYCGPDAESMQKYNDKH